MKRTFYFVALVILVAVTITSCTASKGGCASSRGYVGYGSK